jgi:hypothetical protein
MAHIPAILEAWDSLKLVSTSHDMSKQATTLKRQCYILEMSFLDWHNVLSTSCRSFRRAEADVLRSYLERLAPEELPDILALHGVWYLLIWMVHWAGRIILYSTASLIYLRFPPNPTERTFSTSASMGSYCLAIARSVKHFLGPNPGGLIPEMVMRIPVSVVQKTLRNEALRDTCDPKVAEAEHILQTVGETELELNVDGSVTETPYRTLPWSTGRN